MFDVHLYFSGSVEPVVNRYLLRRGANRLSTFAYPKEAYTYLKLADQLGLRANMLIDSGAFTAWSVGKPVKLADLIAYNDKLLRDYGDRHSFTFISLDAIPGERGRAATSDEIAKAVDISYAQFCEMQQHFRGHYVLPVFHSGEDFRLRNAYLHLTDYVCLSMDQGMPEHMRLSWAKRAAVPGFKFHGLAATGNRMVTEVPWFSVDSSSWVTVGSMGGILWPRPDGTFRVLAVSHNSPSRHNRGEHYLTLTPVEQARAAAYIRAQGFCPDRMGADYNERIGWNVMQWLNPPWRRKRAPHADLFADA